MRVLSIYEEKYEGIMRSNASTDRKTLMLSSLMTALEHEFDLKANYEAWELYTRVSKSRVF